MKLRFPGVPYSGQNVYDAVVVVANSRMEFGAIHVSPEKAAELVLTELGAILDDEDGDDKREALAKIYYDSTNADISDDEFRENVGRLARNTLDPKHAKGIVT